jgi:lipoyl(octanoyl) transferase
MDPFRGLGKIAALGVKLSQHRSYHGVALNVAMDLEPFSRIDPCGYPGLATIDLATLGVALEWQAVADGLGQRLARQLALPGGDAQRARLADDARRQPDEGSP